MEILRIIEELQDTCREGTALSAPHDPLRSVLRLLGLLRLLRLLLDGGLLRLGDGHRAGAVRRWQGLLGGGHHEHSVGRQRRGDRVRVHAVGQLVAAAEAPRDEAVLVLPLLVLALHHHEAVRHLDGQLLRFELIHVQVDAHGVLVVGEVRHAAVPLVLGAPRPQVVRGEQRDRRRGQRRRQQLVAQQNVPEVLVEEAGGAVERGAVVLVAAEALQLAQKHRQQGHLNELGNRESTTKIRG